MSHKIGVVVSGQRQWESFLTNNGMFCNSYNSSVKGEINGKECRFFRVVMPFKEDTSNYQYDAMIYEYMPPVHPDDFELLEDDEDA